MHPVARRVFERSFPRIALYRRVIKQVVQDPDSYLHQTGWIRSLTEQRPVDKDGNHLPWMNYPVIHFLQARLRADFDLFEFGSGFSTAFYAQRVRSVVSVEYDPAWYEQVGPGLPANARLMLQAQDVDGAYCRSITATGQRFDMVVVDGRDRVNCVRQSLDCLSERGVILLDDSQRERYAEAFELARGRGFSALSFEGLKPTGTQTDRTTLFYRPGNCLAI